MKNPYWECTKNIAPIIIMPIPKAMNLPKKPTSSAIDPSDSPMIIRKATVAGLPDLIKYSIVALKPLPPNRPSNFPAPWGIKTILSANRATKTPISSRLAINRAIAFFMILPPLNYLNNSGDIKEFRFIVSLVLNNIILRSSEALYLLHIYITSDICPSRLQRQWLKFNCNVILATSPMSFHIFTEAMGKRKPFYLIQYPLNRKVFLKLFIHVQPFSLLIQRSSNRWDVGHPETGPERDGSGRNRPDAGVPA